MTRHKTSTENGHKSPTEATERGQRVIQIEADGLLALAASLTDERADAFEHSVALITNCDRHLVVVGVGKSGHIGQKLAASFASTGTPSFFMHPTEASHGDLGMLMPGCVVLAISNSGESRELADVLSFCRRSKISVIGITAAPESSLGRGSNIVLQMPKHPEACPNRLAPTTSTTMALALGDALVVAAMEQRGFTSADFGQRHPGGKLGRRLQTLDDWLAANPHDVPHVTPDTSAEDVVMAISKGQNGCVAVIEDSRSGPVFVGMITDGDLRRAMTPDFFKLSAADIMTAKPLTLRRDQTMGQVIDVLVDRRIATAFIVDDGQTLGLVNTKTLAVQGYI